MSTASIGVCSSVRLEAAEVRCFRSSSTCNLSTYRKILPLTRRIPILAPTSRQRSRIGCLLPSGAVSPLESEEKATTAGSDSSSEDEFSHVTKFKMSDFDIRDRVSIGLGGRVDEVVFEANVKDSTSQLFNKRVVLRQLITARAKRRGRRAIEVLKKLARRRLMYHSYSMQVHGYVCSSTSDHCSSFTLVHGYHGNSSLRHWLQRSDWLPMLEATLALDEEYVRRVGDDTVGGPAVSRQLRLIRIIMRDLLIAVNYLHSHGLAHTELRLENLHISPVDRHIKVGILGNAADFHGSSQERGISENNTGRRKMMIAFDMRCLGYIMAKMVLRELMDPLVYGKFKAFLTKGNDPSCLREFLLRTINRSSSSGNAGLQILDRNSGAGWNLLSQLLATKPFERISCLDALRHPFLCGPKWRVQPCLDIIRWSLGSTAVRISEEYIYNQQQKNQVAILIELMEMVNPHSKPKHWLDLLPGKWRLLYSTGRHIGLSIRQPPMRVLIGNVFLTVSKELKPNATFSFASDVDFSILVGQEWPHDKSGVGGKLHANSLIKLRAGKRLYIREADARQLPTSTLDSQSSALQKLSSERWQKVMPQEEFPSSLLVAKLTSNDTDVSMSLHEPLGRDVQIAQQVLREVRLQIPPEMFDLSKCICGTYVDSRLLILRSVSGSALFFIRSSTDE